MGKITFDNVSNGYFRPTVSMVMPLYNAEDYVGEAIESILSQTFNNWELVVVNDGSTDSSPRIVEKYAQNDHRIKLIHMPQPSGSAYQPRKTAIISASADLVAPLDADDFIEATYLEQLLERHSETKATLIYPTMYRPSNGTWKLFIPSSEEIRQLVTRGSDIVKFTIDGWNINCNGGLIEKALYLEVYSRYDSNLSDTFDDEFLTRQLLYHASIVAFSPAKYFYRINETSITRAKSLKIFDMLKSNIKIFDFVVKHFPILSEEYTLIHRHLFHGIFDALRVINRYDFGQKELSSVYELMQENINLLDWHILKEQESAIYFYFLRLMKSHLQIARYPLKWGDDLRSKFKDQ